MLERTTRLALAPFLVLALFTSACAANKEALAPPSAAPEARADVANAAGPMAAPMPGAAAPASAVAAPSLKGASPAPAPANAKGADATSGARAEDNMVIYTGEVHMQADEERLAATLDQVIDVAESLGGHLAGRTDGSVVVKVPSARFREAMTKLEPLGIVTHRSVTAQDVTAEFHDAEVRLQNLKATRQRLQEFLAKASNIPDTLTVERELERVAQEIDVLEGRLRFLRERASYSQITVQVTAKPKPVLAKDPPPPPPPPPAAQRVLDLPVEWFGKLGVDRLLNLR